MQLIPFLESATNNQESLANHRVILFQAKEYPIVFLSQFFAQLKVQQHYFETIACDTLTPQEVFAKLEMSFLGFASLYWLTGMEDLDEKRKAVLIAYLKSYTGVHTVFGFVSPEVVVKDHKNLAVITVPEAVDAPTFQAVANYFQKPNAQKNSIFQKMLFAHTPAISLDQVCIAVHYAQLVGKDAQLFCKTWLDSIITPEKSLFVLSQHFFAKDAKLFFAMWAQIGSEFGIPFWISFWSEQVWRASFFISYQEQKQFAHAKKISFRLPFSFMQRDWKKIQRDELTHAHAFLYDLDFNFKNSNNESTSLDLFFAKFFGNQFLKK